MSRVEASPSGPAFTAGQPIEQIVVPIARDQIYDRGVAIGARLAERWGLGLRLVHVNPDDRVASDAGQGPEGDATIDLSGIDSIRDRVVSLHPSLSVEWALDTDTDVARGIARAVDDRSLLVVASENASEWVGVGSVGEAVVRAVSQPVLLCGPGTDSEFVDGGVVLGVDGSPTAEIAIEPAVALAASLPATLWLVAAVDPATVDHVSKLRAQGQRVSESGYVSDLCDHLRDRGVDVGWEVVHGDDPVDALIDFADARGAGFIVVASHGESGLARQVFGSVSMGLVAASTLPVLVVNAGPAHEPELTE